MSKRLFDIFFSVIALFFSSVFIILLYILATLDTRQNGFFLQKRIGQYGKLFTIYKLRTFGYSKKNPVSKFGAFLRNSKLDELPQLWNVLHGNMSFVGPRPDIAGYYDLLEGENRKILTLKPGLTSLASIKYAKEDDLLRLQRNPLAYNDKIIFPDKVRMNLDYYYNHSLYGDLKILFNTLFRCKSSEI
jgi:lipopolysaccharide/colanic/teichoic acid biosynthesis glycosyltransferase